MIREAACVGIVLLDPLTGFVLQEAVEDVGRFVRGRRDDLRGEGRVLIGDVAIGGQSGPVAKFWCSRLIEDAGGMSTSEPEVADDPERPCREAEAPVEG